LILDNLKILDSRLSDIKEIHDSFEDYITKSTEVADLIAKGEESTFKDVQDAVKMISTAYNDGIKKNPKLELIKVNSFTIDDTLMPTGDSKNLRKFIDFNNDLVQYQKDIEQQYHSLIENSGSELIRNIATHNHTVKQAYSRADKAILHLVPIVSWVHHKIQDVILLNKS
jgi:hypothetical protein